MTEYKSFPTLPPRGGEPRPSFAPAPAPMPAVPAAAPVVRPAEPLRMTPRPQEQSVHTPAGPVPAPAQPTGVNVVARPHAPSAPASAMRFDLEELLEYVVETGASDLHLAADSVPRVRTNGKLMDVPNRGEIDAEDMETLLLSLMNPRQVAQFKETNDIDLAHKLKNKARFRVNVFKQLGKIGSVMRLIPTRVRTVDEMEIPDEIQQFARLPRGLILVTGPTGSGKSTLLASLIDLANRTRPAHIVTIEDPVEFTHHSQMATVTQRQVGDDTESFSTALRAVLRQDPDIILVGEMRDLVTTQAAIEAAETGHLVFATMHTKSTYETISRIVNMFPDGVQNQIQSTLASALEGVVTQILVETADGKGRVAAREVMILNDAVRSQIRSGKLISIKSTLQTSKDEGMYTLDTDLARLVREGKVSLETAKSLATDASDVVRKSSTTNGA